MKVGTLKLNQYVQKNRDWKKSTSNKKYESIREIKTPDW